MGHELLCLSEDVVGVDQDFADIGLEIVANRPYDQAAFLVDQERALLAACGAFDRRPQLQQIVQVPLQFFLASADRRCARNQAHPGRDLKLIHHLAQFGALVALDTTGDTASTRVVGHQHQIAACQGDVGRERCALVAALVFFDLDDEFLTHLEPVLRPGLALSVATGEVAAGNLLERKKSVTLRAVIDEGGFEAGFKAGDHRLVYVALAFFLGGRFDVKVDQPLAIDNRDAEFLGLRRIEKHAFHVFRSPA